MLRGVCGGVLVIFVIAVSQFNNVVAGMLATFPIIGLTI